MQPVLLAAEAVEQFGLVRDFAVIMAVAGVVVVLFRKLNQPPILGYLLAGLIVGPFTLPELSITNAESIRLLADLGLVLLLFAIGLEFGWRRIRQVGPSALLIGSVEILGMISLGYGVGKLLGWTSQEAFYLGAALSISSSAILIKVLRDTGQLTSLTGRLIVGILVVEDFAAVGLLSLLSGVATTGTTDAGDVGRLVMKLAIFAAASLALGAIFVPRIIKFVGQFGSRETMLLTTLALCFCLALVGESLGISAAAGAFLIGTVVGDTEESAYVADIMEPVRDMFGAVFFVSIGMLIDIQVIKDHLVPVAAVSLVFVAGKIVANSVGAFVSGQPGRTPLQVGMGMPQIGEFSLAMVKVGVEHQAIGAFIYQVVAGVTAVTSLFYPYIMRSTDKAVYLLERLSPTLFRRSLGSLSTGFQTFRMGLRFDSEFARRVRRSAIPVGINLLIIVVLIGTGGFLAGLAPRIGREIGVSETIVGTIIGFTTLMLCIPAVIALWLSLRPLADEVTNGLITRHWLFRTWVRDRLRNLVRDCLALLLLVFIAVWSLPLVTELLSLGSLAAPLPLVLLAVVTLVAIRTLTNLHHLQVTAFSRTLLGTEDTEAVTPASEPEAAPSGSLIQLGFPPPFAPSFRPFRRLMGTKIKSRRRLSLIIGSSMAAAIALSWALGYWLTSGSVWWFL
jgi:CPA2 family monovalent cation:H+ antiporter-2